MERSENWKVQAAALYFFFSSTLPVVGRPTYTLYAS